MSLKKFGPKDIITNTMKTHPSCEFFINDSQIYYNNIPYTSGTISHGASVPISSGYASLFEMNVDRLSASALVVAGGLPGGRFIGGTSAENVIADYTLLSSGAPWMVGHGATAGGGTGTYTYSSTAADGLQGWWKLKGNAPAVGAPDLAGDNDGTISAGMDGTWPGTSTIPTSGYGMTRVSRWPEAGGEGINVGAATTWNGVIGKGGAGTSKMTFAVWINYSGTGESRFPRIFQFGDTADSAGGVRAYVNTNGKILFRSQFSSNRGEWRTTDAVITSDTWTHVVITYDGGGPLKDPTIYINGSSIGAVGSGLTEVQTPVGTWGGIINDDCFIGSLSDGAGTAGSQGPGSKSWYGMMTQFSVWNIILTSDDVATLYNAALGPPGGGEVYTSIGGYVPSQIVDTGLVYPFVTKDGTRLSLAGLYTGSTYDLDFQYGDVVTGSYPMSASITRELIGWYPVGCAAGSATCAEDKRLANIDFLSTNGPYGTDTSGGSRGAGQLDTGRSDLYPTSENTESVDTSDEAEHAKCGNRKPITAPTDSAVDTAGGDGWSLNPNDGFPASPGNITCNSPKWPHYWALKNTLNKYGVLSENYKVTSSYGIKDQQIINLISIPSIFYGSKIKPGSVSLKWYLTGTLIGELRDTRQNGELIEHTTSCLFSSQTATGNVAGVVLYNEGFIALTGAWALHTDPDAQLTIRSGSGNTFYAPMWIDWGTGANDNCNKLTTSTSGSESPVVVSASNNLESASFGLSFKGTSETQTLTMFANARRGEINYSNNPTFLTYTASVTSSFFTSSEAYVEDPNRQVINFVSSSHPDYSASFKRQVYISKVGIYDENKNLIGVATMSNPVRKAEDQDLTFKLKIDI